MIVQNAVAEERSHDGEWRCLVTVSPNWCCRPSGRTDRLRRVSTPNPYQAAQQQVVDQPLATQPVNKPAVTALVLGIITVILGMWIPLSAEGSIMISLAFLPAVLAIVFGHVGAHVAKRIGVGRGAARIGFITGYLIIAVSIGTVLYWINALQNMYGPDGAISA